MLSNKMGMFPAYSIAMFFISLFSSGYVPTMEIIDLAIKDGLFPWQTVSLPDGNVAKTMINYPIWEWCIPSI